MADQENGATTPENQAGTPPASEPTTPPAAPAPAAPAAPAPATPPVASTPASDDAKARAEKAEADLAQARRLQAQADRRYRKEHNARIRAERRLQGTAASPSPTGEEEDDDTPPATPAAENVEVEREKARRSMIQKVYSDPRYRAVVESDPTMANLLNRDPLLLVEDPVDAEDAVDQLEDMLEERISKAPSSAAPQPTVPGSQPAAAPAPATPPAEPPKVGTANPVEPQTPNTAKLVETGNVEQAVTDKLRNPASWRRFGSPQQ